MFTQIARRIADITGSVPAVIAAVTLVALWAASGPFLDFSAQWQLIINTFTTVITFLMVFFIQHAQEVDTHAIHVKLDELILAVDKANNEAVEIEEHTEDLDSIQTEHHKIRGSDDSSGRHGSSSRTIS